MTCNRLAPKVDGTKPFIVFNRSKRDIEKLKKEYRNKCIRASSTNGWMDDDLTFSWTKTVIGQFLFACWLLAWDTYMMFCHLQNFKNVKIPMKECYF